MNMMGHNRRFNHSMYAIAFDLDTDTLKKSYHNASWQNVYNDIAKFLRDRGFDRQQGSVYFSGDDVDVVRCQTAVQSLTLEYDWFAPAVRDIRMLRIEDSNDLTPAIELALQFKKMAK